MKPNVLILTGPTGSGKTELILRLASKFPISVINADSLQFFRKMDLGTAKPTAEERETCPHHLYDVLNPDEEANAAWFSEESDLLVQRVASEGRIPCLVGGSGFYLRAFENPPDGPAMDHPQLEAEELENAYARIQKEDPEGAEKIHPNDAYRITRAISLLNQKEKPSTVWARTTAQEPRYPLIWLGLAMERKTLYDRINRRTERMFQEGLLEETQEVLRCFPKSRARLERTIGYREALEHLEGKMSLEMALEKTQQSSRQYAKRQLTWFRREDRMHWFSPEEAFEKTLQLVKEQIQ